MSFVRSLSHPTKNRCFLGALAGAAALLWISCSQGVAPTKSSTTLSTPKPEAAISTLNWMGYTWDVTNGGMAGVAPGSGNNVTVDANGYLHLKIQNKTAAEIFTQAKLGFGTYQWEIEGAVDNMDKSTVLGLFPYGPQAGIGGDGENELDIEWSKWNGNGSINADFTFYPATGYGDGNLTPSYTSEFKISLGGSTLSTARTEWSSSSVKATIMSGIQPVGTTANILKTYTYAPTSPKTKIPQVAVPLGINFWSYQAQAASTQEVIIRAFRFIPEGSNPTTYTITASSGTGGSISPSGSVTVNQGASQSFTITPNSGYTISSVTVDGVNQGAISSYTFSNVQAAHTIQAAFTASTPTQYTITASAGTGGTITPSGSVKVNQGSSQSFTIAANSGYAISSVTVDGTNQGAISSYTFSNVQAAHTISAAFTASGSDSNIAPSGTGYVWSKNSSATSNSNKTAKAGVNDNNLTTDVVVNSAGEGGTAKWEAAGVTFSAAKTVSSVKFINGTVTTGGDGYFEANCKLQFSTDGTTWVDSGWSISPAYPNSSAASGVTYTFSGTAKSGVLGVRVTGQTGGNSWYWIVKEVQVIGH